MARSAPAVTTGGNGHASSSVLDAPRRPHPGSAPVEPRRRPARRASRAGRRWPATIADSGEPPVRSRPPVAMLGALGFVLLLALLLRVAAARQLSLQVDEPATILAAHQVAERGLPILPSGTLYLHGATLSYALAPFVWLGAGDLDDLLTLRLVSVVAGVVAVALTYVLAARVGGAAWVGVLAAFLLALDASSVQWSAHVRMYALLQALTLAVILLYLRLLARPAGRALVIGLAIAFWLATLTHVGAATIWPAMAAVAVVAHGRRLLHERRDLSIALGLCLLAPVSVSALNRLLQPVDYGEVAEIPFFSFAGAGLFNGERFQAPVPVSWQELFGQGYANDFLPYVVVALAGLLVGRVFLGPSRPDRRRTARAAGSASERVRRLEIAALIAILVTSILAVSLFTLDQQARYLLHVHPLDYVLLAAGLAALTREIRLPAAARLLPTWRRWLPLCATAGLAAFVALAIVADGLAVRFRTPVINPDQLAALDYVAAHRQPGELVIVPLTPAPYLALGGREDLAFLAGEAETVRVTRYTRLTENGRRVDYWVGVDAITSTGELCEVLLARPGAWLILDDARLGRDWAYGARMTDLILRMSELVAVAPGGTQIYRAARPPGATADASICTAPAADPATEPLAKRPDLRNAR